MKRETVTLEPDPVVDKYCSEHGISRKEFYRDLDRYMKKDMDPVAAESAVVASGDYLFAMRRGLISPKEYKALMTLRGLQNKILFIDGRAEIIETIQPSEPDKRIVGRMVYRLQEKYNLDVPEEKLITRPIPTFRTRLMKQIGHYPC